MLWTAKAVTTNYERNARVLAARGPLRPAHRLTWDRAWQCTSCFRGVYPVYLRGVPDVPVMAADVPAGVPRDVPGVSDDVPGVFGAVPDVPVMAAEERGLKPPPESAKPYGLPIPAPPGLRSLGPTSSGSRFVCSHRFSGLERLKPLLRTEIIVHFSIRGAPPPPRRFPPP